MKKIVWIFFSITSLLLFLSVTLFHLFGLEIVLTKDDSLPYSVYLSRPLKHIERGMIVTFYHADSKRMFGKEIVGLPGDSVEVKEGSVFVAGKDFGKVMERSQSGRIYHPISPCVIPDGLCFLCGSHEYSFDSRYKELGLIPTEELKREMWPLY